MSNPTTNSPPGRRHKTDAIARCINSCLVTLDIAVQENAKDAQVQLVTLLNILADAAKVMRMPEHGDNDYNCPYDNLPGDDWCKACAGRDARNIWLKTHDDEAPHAT